MFLGLRTQYLKKKYTKAWANYHSTNSKMVNFILHNFQKQSGYNLKPCELEAQRAILNEELSL